MEIKDQLAQRLNLLQSWKGKHFVTDLPPHTLQARIKTGQARVTTVQARNSDASDMWCGAVSENCPDPIARWFLHPQLEEHINLKETRALLEAIQVCNLRNVHLQLYTDSTTVFWYIKKWGGEVYA